MKKANLFFLALFAACIAVPLACFNTEKDVVSDINNAKLTELDFSDGLDMDNVMDYVNDRIGLRSEALTAYQVLNDRLFGEMEHPTYCYGKEGYVFGKLQENKVDEAFIRAFCDYLGRIQTYCEERGVPFIYVVTPAKATVYTQYLPEGYIYNDKLLDCLYENLERCGINYVDNAAYLKEVAREEQIFNVKFDSSHWNDLGEFYGMNNILQKVRTYFPAVQLLQLTDYEIEQVEKTSLPVSHFAISEMVPSFHYTKSDRVTYLEGFDDIRLSPQHQVFSASQTEQDGAALPSVLFFHGSYFNRNIGMFNFAFGQEYSVHNYQNVLDFEYYFNIFQPDCVIFETAEYATTSAYFSPEKMEGKTLNPTLESRDLTAAHTVTVAEGAAAELPDLGYQQNQGSRLVTMTASVEAGYSYGYYVSGGCTYDLELSEGALSVTADAQRSDLRSGTIYLFK